MDADIINDTGTTNSSAKDIVSSNEGEQKWNKLDQGPRYVIVFCHVIWRLKLQTLRQAGH